MFDLFGNYFDDSKPKKTFEQEYAEYINSATWKKIRAAKIKQAGGECERCHLSKWSVKLEVHHKNYKHFKHESLDDLEVLCPACHAPADEKRKEETEEDREKSPLAIGFQNWMDRGNEKDWRRFSDGHLSTFWKTFISIISKKSRKDYRDVPFKRRSNWY